MEHKNKIKVIIGRRVYTLVGEESEEYMQRVALYIDKKMNEVLRTESSQNLSTNMLAVLTSINVADDLFKMREKVECLQKEMQKYQSEIEQREKELQRYQDELGRAQEENLALRERMEEMQLETLRSRMELEEYINTFEKNERIQKSINNEKRA
jgi:cell division protein ZapA